MEIFRQKKNYLPSFLFLFFPLFSAATKWNLPRDTSRVGSFPELFIHDERKTHSLEFSRILFYKLFSRNRGFSVA